MTEKRAEIFKYESFATHDGDGIRFGVFFSGCNLRCDYCHNPEAWCNTKNNFCEGITVTVDELVNKIRRYKPYFKNGGGATFSGGEPLLQAEFLYDVIEKLNQNGINSFIDTSGGVILSDSVKKALNLCQTVILDIKFYTENDYEKYCKGSLNQVLDFFNYLESINKSVWLRTVIIPSVNDSEIDVERYFNLVKNYKNVVKYELLPFHTMGFGKYEKLNLVNNFADKKDMDIEKTEKLQNYLNNFKLMQK